MENAWRRSAYLDQHVVEDEIMDALTNRKTVCTSNSWMDVTDGDGEPRMMDYRSFANDPEYQDDEAWAFPYGEVIATVTFPVRDYEVEFEFHMHVEEGKAHRYGPLPMVQVTLHDPYNGDCILDASGMESEMGQWRGGAEFWFSPNPGDSFVHDVLWDEELVDEIAYAVTERDEYAKMMGLASRKTAAFWEDLGDGIFVADYDGGYHSIVCYVGDGWAFVLERGLDFMATTVADNSDDPAPSAEEAMRLSDEAYERITGRVAKVAGGGRFPQLPWFERKRDAFGTDQRWEYQFGDYRIVIGQDMHGICGDGRWDWEVCRKNSSGDLMLQSWDKFDSLEEAYEDLRMVVFHEKDEPRSDLWFDDMAGMDLLFGRRASGDWRDMGDYCVSPSGIEFRVEEFVDPSWPAYDRSVAEAMLSNYGEIYVDRYGLPIDDEYDQEEISHAWDSDSAWARSGLSRRTAMPLGDVPRWFADKVYQLTGKLFKDFDLMKLWDLVYDADTCLEDAIDNAVHLLGPTMGIARRAQFFGYEPKTTFWQDFSIADMFGAGAVRGTFDRAFAEWKSDYVYLTELVMVLNWKLWEHYEAGDDGLAELYNELWGKADLYAQDNLTGEELDYFYRTTD